MAKEEREKRESMEKEIEGRSDNLAKLQTEKEAAVRERDDLIEQVINKVVKRIILKASDNIYLI